MTEQPEYCETSTPSVSSSTPQQSSSPSRWRGNHASFAEAMDTGSTPTLLDLYEWVLTCEEEFAWFKSIIPSRYKADRDRLIMSFSAFRVTLELRFKLHFPKRPPARDTGRGSHDGQPNT